MECVVTGVREVDAEAGSDGIKNLYSSIDPHLAIHMYIKTIKNDIEILSK